MQITLNNAEHTQAIAANMATLCQASQRPWVIHLEGNLGAGKTTFSQGFIRAFGYSGRVKSPTYTLVEPYEVENWRLFHFDLYRLSDPEELEFIGIRDYVGDDCISLIEWPDKGAGLLPDADIKITIAYDGQNRQLSMAGCHQNGQALITTLIQQLNLE